MQVSGILLLGPGQLAAQRTITIPAGTGLPVRFLESVQGGQSPIGAVVTAQTMGAVAVGGCLALHAYALVRGRVEPPMHHGHLRLSFDAIAAGGTWYPLEARLDSLEFSPRAVNDSGTVTTNGRRIAKVGRSLLPLGVAAAAEVLVVPAAVLSGYLLVRRRQPAKIMAGEMGRLRLSAPLTLPAPAACFAIDPLSAVATVPT
ncbi:MAG: hypothetical protein ACHQXA_11305, partial [Gemmatimonadales bacterium]